MVTLNQYERLMMKLTVHVKLVSPLMLGGAEQKQLDTLNWLRPSSIRGMLHFWFRAVCQENDTKKLLEVEKQFFGGTKNGSTFKIIPTIISNPSIEKFELFPKKEGKAKASSVMYGVTEELLSIQIMAHSLDSKSLQHLHGLLGLWLHLGSLGRRSRRGYGSLLWAPEAGDSLVRFFKPIDPQVCDSAQKLETQLKSTLKTVSSLLEFDLNNGSRGTNDFFKLTTLDQVFVGKTLKTKAGNIAKFADQADEMQDIIHGRKESARLIITSGSPKAPAKEKNEMGRVDFHNKSRMASPMLWRLYRCGGGFVPVMTWSPRTCTTLTPGTEMYKYLTNTLGFNKSLLGNPL